MKNAGARIEVVSGQQAGLRGTVEREVPAGLLVKFDDERMAERCYPPAMLKVIENPCDVCGAEFGTGDCDDCADKRAADARGAAGWS